MRNIFLFIRRYIAFFTFLILQVVALWFFFSYNRFHRAKFLGMANEMTGEINSQYNKVEDFFRLKKENRRLHRFNDSLLNLLPGNFSWHDTTVKPMRDSIPIDTTGFYRKYFLYPAEVVYNTVSSEKNYIQLNRGSNQGVMDDWGVISSEGNVVGVVINVSPNFCQVRSLLHVQNRLDVALKKTGNFGTLMWDGKDPQNLTLLRIPGSTPLEKGDSIITSGNNDFTFPKGFLVGTISSIDKDKASNVYILKVKPAANFFNLQHVHLIDNIDRNEQIKLLEETKKKVEQNKLTNH
jgi:rod shape-determining protein MreC